jgi:putative flippase GtrA
MAPKRSGVLHRYALIGIVTVAIDYLGLFTAYTLLHLHYAVAAFAGLFLAGVFQFYANFHFTFRVPPTQKKRNMMLRYVMAVLAGMALSLAVIVLLMKVIPSFYVAKTLSLIVSFLYGFTVSKYYIYRH